MCMEDIRIAKKSVLMNHRALLSTTTQMLVPYDENRTSLLISGNSTVEVRLSWGEGGDGVNGVVLQIGGPGLLLNIYNHGAILRGPIWAVSVTNPATVCWVESTFNGVPP